MPTAPKKEYSLENYINIEDVSPISAIESLGLRLKNDDKGYSNSVHLLLILFASISKSSLEAVSNALREANLEIPSADAVIKNITKPLKKIEDMFNKFFANIASIAWIQGIPATVAIDVTDELYYGDIDGVMVTPTKPRKGAKFAFRFLTASIVSRFGKFVIYTRLIRPGENVSKLVRSVVRAIRKVVDIKWLVLDKWFYKVAVVKGLK